MRFPQLQDKKYTLGTKIYWLLMDISDFPKCIRDECNNKLHKNAIVTTGYGKGYCSIYCEVNDYRYRQKVINRCIEKFGTNTYPESIEFKEMMSKKALERTEQEKNAIVAKREETCNKHYGIRNVLCKGNIRDRIEQENLKKFGRKTTNNPEKARLTRKLHAKNDPDFQAKVNDKTRKTKELHRQLNPNYDIDIIKRINETRYKKRLKDPQYDLKIYEKHMKTYYEKTGYYWPAQNPDVKSKMRRKYTYNDIMFDSSPEIAYYIWLTDNNIKFEFHPKIRLKYYANGKLHFYEPDFLICKTNQLEDIKGDHFLKTHFIKRAKEKFDCMKQNNIRLIFSNEYKIYMDYCAKKFNDKHWYLKFKNF